MYFDFACIFCMYNLSYIVVIEITLYFVFILLYLLEYCARCIVQILIKNSLRSSNEQCVILGCFILTSPNRFQKLDVTLL